MHPYKSLPQHAFWRHCINSDDAFGISRIWDPKFSISNRDEIATYGSCFAQHIGRALKARGFRWLRTEPAVFGMQKATLKEFGYELFSSRTGNIYTSSQMLQWTEWAMDPGKMPGEIWKKRGRFYDPLRPNLEPNGFASVEEVTQARKITCAAFRQSVEQAQVFVFTLGLTERWRNLAAGFEYAICPPRYAFDPETHGFSNMSCREVEEALARAILNLRKMNPALKILLTVSPVPLAATATGGHVWAATTYSKSVLRAVAGQAAQDYDFVDYFPSYEIIKNPLEQGWFFEPDMRRVNQTGVSRVMDVFFGAQEHKFGNIPDPLPDSTAGQGGAEDVVCEEELLAAFGDKK